MAKNTALFQFTQKELDGYIKDDNSCVKCVPSKMHIGFPPFGLDNFKDTLLAIISKKKIGLYDEESKGIVLDVRKIKLEGTFTMIRHDSPELHLNIQAQFYVFRPNVGALLKGTVKYISKRHVSALIYNVFNVSIRLGGDFKRKLQVNKDILFRVKKFDLENILPYIEGELLVGEDNADSGIGGDKALGKGSNKKITFSDPFDSSSNEESDNETMFKKMVVKTESLAKISNEDSSSESDSSEDLILAPVAIKKEQKRKGSTKSSSSSDESSDDNDLPPAANTVQPRTIKQDKNATDDCSRSSDEDIVNKLTSNVVNAMKTEEQSDSSSSSNEEDFKIPLPIKEEVSLKNETTPFRRKNDCESKPPQEMIKSPSNVKRQILQSPVTTKKDSKGKIMQPALKSPTLITVRDTSALKDGDMASKINDIMTTVVQRYSEEESSEREYTKVGANKKAATDSSSSESDEDEDNKFNSSIKNLLNQVYSAKTNKRASSINRQGANGKTTRKRKLSTTEYKKREKKDGDLLKFFANDALSSTRLDANSSPIPKKKKKIKE